MPIPYEELKYKDILHHQLAYECFDRAGKKLFTKWNIIDFERAVLGDGEPCYLKMADQVKAVPNLYGNLNRKMPFLRFREKGLHYGYELFLSPPPSWGSRGAPFWWAYAARKFTFDLLPMDEDYFYQKYKSIAREFDLHINNNNAKYIERFAAGGMSSGIVMEQFVREGWYAVRHRNRLYQTDKEVEEYYLDKAIERINQYCGRSVKTESINREKIDQGLFYFVMEDSKATEHQKQIVTELWGLKSGKPMSVREVADKHHISLERVYQIERYAIRHLIRGKNNLLLNL